MSTHKVISLSLVSSDKFLDLEIDAQCLFFHLIMNSQDNFHIRSPFAMTRILGVQENLLDLLIEKGFLEKIGDDTFIHAQCRPYDITKRPNWNRWKELRLSVFRRDNYFCGYCGKHTEKPECDHIIPISKGGDSGYDNLITACKKCNRTKSNKLNWSLNGN